MFSNNPRIKLNDWRKKVFSKVRAYAFSKKKTLRMSSLTRSLVFLCSSLPRLIATEKCMTTIIYVYTFETCFSGEYSAFYFFSDIEVLNQPSLNLFSASQQTVIRLINCRRVVRETWDFIAIKERKSCIFVQALLGISWFLIYHISNEFSTKAIK